MQLELTRWKPGDDLRSWPYVRAAAWGVGCVVALLVMGIPMLVIVLLPPWGPSRVTNARECSRH